MKNYNYDNFKLYSVNVSQQWTTEAQAIILADSLDKAEKIAERNVDLNSWDAWSCGVETLGKEIPITNLPELIYNPDFYYIAPTDQGETIFGSQNEFEKFKSLLSPEKMEELRIIQIEKNNGQISLFEV